jgi:hypothetical protein
MQPDTLAANYGGVNTTASKGVHLTIDIGTLPTTFEQLGASVICSLFTGVAVTIYRPSSVAVARDFFVKSSAIFSSDFFRDFPDHVPITCAVNIRLDRADDVLATFAMVCHVPFPTHIGGLLDIVITYGADLQGLPVDIIGIAISNHRLLQWTVPCMHPTAMSYAKRRCLTRKTAVVPTMSA